ncbi:MAG: rRNA maturation RNase YbeY [Chloracidobacterium sp.]|nr:rRNA maturation RNase YbeY [Chloracidobacterium sp.]
MIDLVNLQRKVKIDTAAIRAFVADLSAAGDEWKGKTFSVAFVSDRRMKPLNQFFRGKDVTTDVLSFPHEPDDLELTTHHSPFTTAFLGDIVISAEQAERQAVENGLDLETEIKQLILHGVLHLCGYDHETDNGEMDAREIGLRKTLDIA